jgi:hypothetical protein
VIAVRTPTIVDLILGIVVLGLALPNLSSRYRDRANGALAAIAGRTPGSPGVFVRCATTAAFPLAAMGLVLILEYLTRGHTGLWEDIRSVALLALPPACALYLCVVLFNRPNWAVYSKYRGQPGLVAVCVRRIRRR